MQSVNELSGWCSEVARLVVLIVLHNRQPLLDRSVISSSGGLPRLSNLDSATGDHNDAQTGWASNSLLRSSNNGIEIPLVESNFFRTDGADAVDDDEGVGADAAGYFGDALDVV